MVFVSSVLILGSITTQSGGQRFNLHPSFLNYHLTVNKEGTRRHFSKKTSYQFCKGRYIKVVALFFF